MKRWVSHSVVDWLSLMTHCHGVILRSPHHRHVLNWFKIKIMIRFYCHTYIHTHKMYPLLLTHPGWHLLTCTCTHTHRDRCHSQRPGSMRVQCPNLQSLIYVLFCFNKITTATNFFFQFGVLQQQQKKLIVMN